MAGKSVGEGKRAFIPALLAGGLVVIVSICGFSLLRERRGIPSEVDRERLVRIDDTEIRGERDQDYILAGKSIGEPALFYWKTPDGRIEQRILPVVPYYAGTNFPVIFFVIGLFCFAVGVGTFLLKPEDPKARLFYWMTLIFGAALIISGETYCLSRSPWTLIPSLAFILAYLLAPALLLRFSRVIFRRPLGRRKFILYVPAVVIGAVQIVSFLYAVLAPSIEMARFFNSQYYLLRIYVVVYFLLTMINFFRGLRQAGDAEEKAQIQWILYGLVIGLFPFIFLYTLPIALSLPPLISEELSAVFYAVIPVSFAIAIIKYKLMQIELLINRSLVYSLLSVFTVGVYLLFVQGSQKIFAGIFVVDRTIFGVIGVFLAAAAFHPALTKIQNIVDKAFFRQTFDYRRTILAFNEKTQGFFGRDELFKYFEAEIRRVLPVESLEILPAADVADRNAGEWTYPLKLASGANFGTLVLGRKKSGGRFAPEDIELLRTMAGELAVNLERIELQEDVIYERASREKADELNRLKTEFISTVSHELRTPMSSIQGLAEILQSGRIKNREQREKYLDLMVSESGRLSRFLHNVLDYGRIEQRAQCYHFLRTGLQDVVREAVDVFGLQLESQGFQLDLRLPDRPVELDIDVDAVKQALINLIDNAVKYSSGRKELEIELTDHERTVEISVRDRGIGITPEEQTKIFDEFHRGPEAGRMCPQGAGLGLKIVRHIMQGHQGEISVESETGKGSVFRLVFPKEKR